MEGNCDGSYERYWGRVYKPLRECMDRSLILLDLHQRAVAECAEVAFAGHFRAVLICQDFLGSIA